MNIVGAIILIGMVIYSIATYPNYDYQNPYHHKGESQWQK